MSLPLLHAGRTNPGLSAALDLRFALDKSLTAYRGPTPSFSRASTGSYFDASGVLRYQGYNLCQYSEDFTNAFWTKSLTSASSNVAIAPNGQQTADKIIESASTGFHSVSNTTFNLAASSTASIYLKAGERGFASVEIVDNFRAVINLSDGTVVSNTLASSTITTENAGNGWWRVKYTTNSSNLGRVIIYPLPTSTFGSYTGDGTSGIFAWGVQVETGATANQYSQTTNSANSGPRFDHTYNGTSWVSRGLLVEEQRTNLLLQSSGFSTASWTQYRGTVTANAATSPDGTGNASNFTQSAGQTVLAFLQQYATTTATQFTLSVFAKANGKNFIVITERLSSAGERYAFFNVSTGSIGTSNAAHTAKIVNVGNGWYRCSITFTALAKNDYFGFNIGDADNSFTCTDSGSVLFYGAMLEAGAFSTSHIETTSASVTRSADVCQITGGDFSGFWNAAEGTLAVEADVIGNEGSNGNQVIVNIGNGTSSNRVDLIRNILNLGGEFGAYVRSSNVEQALLATSANAWPVNLTEKAAFAFKANDFSMSYNGASPSVDTSGSIPSSSMMVLGNFSFFNSCLNGHIARLRYYRKRLPNATLQLLSEPDPTLNLQFALNRSLTPVAGPAPSFSRASTGSYFDSTGTLKYANVNLLTYSEQFDNAAWTDKAGSTLYTNAAASPNGDLSADQLQLSNSGYYYQKKAYTTTGTHTFSVWLRSSSPTTTLLRLSNDAGTENSVATCNVTTSWQRFSVTRNWSANPINFYAGLDQRTVVGGPGTSTDVFIWGAQLELASSPSQYAKTEASTTAGPRFDHVYSGGQWVSRGLLIEEQRTNLLPRSEEFNTGWTNNDINISTNSVTAPDGTLTADNLVPNTVNTNHRLYQGPAGSGVASVSVFAKSTGYGWLQVRVGAGGGTSVTVNFDIVNGAIGDTVLAGGATASGQSIENVGNGWWRCKFTTASVPAFTTVIMPRPDNASVEGQAYAGDGVKGVAVWGAQLENASFPTSYIGTTSSAVVRSVDVCQITGTSFGSMWNQGEGSVAFEYDLVGSAIADRGVCCADDSADARRIAYYGSLGSAPNVGKNGIVMTNTSLQAYVGVSTVNFNTPIKFSACYKLNDVVAYSGLDTASDTSCTIPNVSTFRIGAGYWQGGLDPLNGHIAAIRYYPARLTNTKLQQLST